MTLTVAQKGEVTYFLASLTKEREAGIIAVGDSGSMEYKTNVHKVLMSSRVHCFKKQNGC